MTTKVKAMALSTGVGFAKDAIEKLGLLSVRHELDEVTDEELVAMAFVIASSLVGGVIVNDDTVQYLALVEKIAGE